MGLLMIACTCHCHKLDLAICPDCYVTHGCSLRQWKNIHEPHFEKHNRDLFVNSLRRRRRELLAELGALEKRIFRLTKANPPA